MDAARFRRLLLLLRLLRRRRPLHLGGFQRRSDGFLRFLRSSGGRCRRRGRRPLYLCGRFLRLRCLRRRRFLRGLRRRLRLRRGGRRQGADRRRLCRLLLRFRLSAVLFLIAVFRLAAGNLLPQAGKPSLFFFLTGVSSLLVFQVVFSKRFSQLVNVRILQACLLRIRTL